MTCTIKSRWVYFLLQRHGIGEEKFAKGKEKVFLNEFELEN